MSTIPLPILDHARSRPAALHAAAGAPSSPRRGGGPPAPPNPSSLQSELSSPAPSHRITVSPSHALSDPRPGTLSTPPAPPNPSSLQPELSSPSPSHRITVSPSHALPPSPLPFAHFELLAFFLRRGCNLAALESEFDLSPEDLVTFASDPKVAARLAILETFTTTSLSLRCAQGRLTAIRALERTIDETDDPIERRRAATSLVRATNTPGMRPSSAKSRGSDHHSAPSEHQSSDSGPGTQDPGHSLVQSAIRNPQSSSPSRPRPARKKPLPTFTSPSPTFHVPATLQVAFTPFQSHDLDTALSILHSFLAPSATVFGDPAPAAPADFIAAAASRFPRPILRSSYAFDHDPHDPARPEHACHIYLYHTDDDPDDKNDHPDITHLLAKLARAADGCWIITSLAESPPAGSASSGPPPGGGPPGPAPANDLTSSTSSAPCRAVRLSPNG